MTPYHEALLARLRHVADILRGPKWGKLSDIGQRLVTKCLWAAMTDAVHEGLGKEVHLILPSEVRKP